MQRTTARISAVLQAVGFKRPSARRACEIPTLLQPDEALIEDQPAVDRFSPGRLRALLPHRVPRLLGLLLSVTDDARQQHELFIRRQSRRHLLIGLKAVANVVEGLLAPLSALGIDASVWRIRVSYGRCADEEDDEEETVHS